MKFHQTIDFLIKFPSIRTTMSRLPGRGPFFSEKTRHSDDDVAVAWQGPFFFSKNTSLSKKHVFLCFWGPQFAFWGPFFVFFVFLGSQTTKKLIFWRPPLSGEGKWSHCCSNCWRRTRKKRAIVALH